jgi:hypothetical protein
MRNLGPDTDGLMEIVGLLPDGGTVVEVGSYAGESMCLWCSRAGKVFCVDPWEAYTERSDGASPSSEEMAAAEKAFDGRASFFPDRVCKMKMESVEAVGLFAAGSVDAVYLDGQHGFADVVRDIVAWRRVVRPVGFIAGHDYRLPYSGVIEAVAAVLGGPDRVSADCSWLKWLGGGRGSVQSCRN